MATDDTTAKDLLRSGELPEVVVCGSPIDLAALLDLDRPVIRARYTYQEVDEPGLGALVDAFVASRRERGEATG